MTALERYAKLEAVARYFDGETAGSREVVLSFGERSLVIMGLDDVAIDHWPLARLRAVGLQGGDSVQLVPDAESDARLVLRDPEMIAAIEAVCPDLRRRGPDRRGLRRALVWGGGAIGALVLLVLVILPGLAERLAPLIPPEQERRFGDTVAAEVRKVLSRDDKPAPLCAAEEGRAALDRMTARLAQGADLPLPLRVDVVRHPLVNAVALPGGRIMLFEGLLDKAESPEEVAGVLAHEIGHVIHRDPTVAMLRTAGTAGVIGLVLGDVFGASILVAATQVALNARYQREQEARADETALDLLEAAKLPSRPFAGFFRRMAEEQGEVPRALRYFSSHPGLGERAERAAEADRIGDRTFEPVLEDRAWVALREICAGAGAGED